MLEVGAMTAASSLARRGRVRGPLNADDAGTPVRELPDTGRAGPRDRQVDDADVVQRKLRGHVLLRPCPSGGHPTPIIAAITPVSSRGRGPIHVTAAHAGQRPLRPPRALDAPASALRGGRGSSPELAPPDTVQVVRRRADEEHGCSLVRKNVRISTTLLSVRDQDLRDAATPVAQFPPRDIVA